MKCASPRLAVFPIFSRSRLLKNLWIIFVVLAYTSCTQGTREGGNTQKDSSFQDGSLDDKISADAGAKIRVDYLPNKELLDVLMILPDSVLSSWVWKVKDRKSWYNEIKSNNYYVDNNPDFFRLEYFKPQAALFTIVEGAWSVSTYKISDSSCLVLVDDMPGHANNITFYELVNHSIRRTIPHGNVLGNYTNALMRSEKTLDCKIKHEQLNEPIFNFDVSEPQKIEIDGSWYLDKEEYSGCLKGNDLLYEFNPRTQKFDLQKISWKTKAIKKSI